MYGFMQVLRVARAVVPRDQHVRADRKADENIDKQVDQRAGGAHRRERRMADELADDDDVGRVEKELQQARKHQRDRKDQDLAEQRPVAHIDFIAARASAVPPAHLQPEQHKLDFSLHFHSVSTQAPLRQESHARGRGHAGAP